MPAFSRGTQAERRLGGGLNASLSHTPPKNTQLTRGAPDTAV